MGIINWQMIRHPENWLIVVLMTMIGLFLLETIAKWAQVNINPTLPSTQVPVGAGDASEGN